MKKKYITPTMEIVKLQQQCQLLAGSGEGINEQLINETVDGGW